MSRTSDTMLAFLVGAVAGGVAALLLAPDKGSETRRKIRAGVTDLYEKGEELIGDAGPAVKGRVEDVSARAVDRARTVKEVAGKHMEAAREAASEAKDAYRRTIEGER